MDDRKNCDICGSEHSNENPTCNYCQGIINRVKNRKAAVGRYGGENVKNALQNAQPSNNKDGKTIFKCHYTNLPVYFNEDRKSGLNPLEDAWVLTIDHKNPKDSSSLVVSSNLINEMKHNIPEDKFKKIVIALGKYFDKKINENELKDLLYSYTKKPEFDM